MLHLSLLAIRITGTSLTKVLVLLDMKLSDLRCKISECDKFAYLGQFPH